MNLSSKIFWFFANLVQSDEIYNCIPPKKRKSMKMDWAIQDAV